MFRAVNDPTLSHLGNSSHRSSPTQPADTNTCWAPRYPVCPRPTLRRIFVIHMSHGPVKTSFLSSQEAESDRAGTFTLHCAGPVLLDV